MKRVVAEPQIVDQNRRFPGRRTQAEEFMNTMRRVLTPGYRFVFARAV